MQSVVVDYWPKADDSVAMEFLKRLLRNLRPFLEEFLGEKREHDCVRWLTPVQESADCCNTSFLFAFAIVTAPCSVAAVRDDSNHFRPVLSRTTSTTSPPF